jgi:large subunit ribosomal protein L21
VPALYAIIDSGGKQYKVCEGDFIELERMEAEEGKTVDISQVLLVNTGKEVKIGTPLVEKAVVKATVMAQHKAKKVIVFKKKRRKQYKKKRGHRQHLTRVRIDKIVQA